MEETGADGESPTGLPGTAGVLLPWRKREFEDFSPPRHVCFSPLDHCILLHCISKMIVSGTDSTNAKKGLFILLN